ncbi:hypothetical protein CEE37_13710 [candidate division LCP-89 bacterium B3_LCP]|uniref:Lipoprotein n=1 Tax=candidate division LCP-89 bacterium B3_LCP TaxID=2012998 RepID=A0A532URJ0_UNCL8|nr:MAG: hypothetical protein CEE37_13710 [candidate division LCP-89 bacterium B3_LCP]
MSGRVVYALLSIAPIIVMCGCAGLQQRESSFFIAGDRTSRSAAHVIREEIIYTTVDFRSEPKGAAVYVYNYDKDKKAAFLGKTPFSYHVTAFNITHYADHTSEYDLEVFQPYKETNRINFADSDNTTGEITFSFLIKKKGFQSKIERVGVAATNEVLVWALAGEGVPGYEVNIALKKDKE